MGTSEDEEGLDILQRRVPAPGPGNAVVVAAACAVTAIAAATFAVAVLTGASVALQGTALAAALAGLALAVRRLAPAVFPHVETAEDRDAPEGSDVPLSDVEPVGRRPLLRRVLVAAGGVVGLALLAPLSALRPPRAEAERGTGWARGTRLVMPTGEPIAADDVPPGGIATVFPSDGVGREIAAVLLVRLSGVAPADPTRLDWMVGDDLVAYSKVCTHAGCPVGLFSERTSTLFCPCHQSSFDAARGATPTFGPPSRPLPQLPLAVDGEGYLIAAGDFGGPVGPAVG
ncbi:MAG: Rieske (2Fe-2S) protein [Euzebyaceae bacterium]|jgi:ubiquinol-cytochrome c reductase iron-sulfur subunit|nr:Rieske (2Fe-2S) protein [Euzebyaceae bacterium]